MADDGGEDILRVSVPLTLVKALTLGMTEIIEDWMDESEVDEIGADVLGASMLAAMRAAMDIVTFGGEFQGRLQ